MTDASECVVAAGELIDGLRTAAVVQRGWLEILVKTFMALGARNLVALPSQLCIPYHEGRAAAAISEHGADLDLALRLTQAAGIGLAIMPDNHQAAAAEVLAALRAVAPSLPVTLYLPQARIGEFQEALRAGAEGAEQQEISLLADTWPNWIGAAGKNSLNLMAGMGGASGTQFNWRQWRWPIALAASVLLINMIALNVDWWRMRREASSLRSGMIQVYKSTYPKETVILDALVQMQRKVGESERNAGQAAPDDFGQIAASFAQALNAQLREQKAAAGAIASLEYREHGLLIHLKPDTKLSTEKMKNALAARNLSLVSPSSGVWQIRSAQ
jgi:general secretion pathway protein L